MNLFMLHFLAASSSSTTYTILMIVAVVALIYFTMIKPQKKEQKEEQSIKEDSLVIENKDDNINQENLPKENNLKNEEDKIDYCPICGDYISAGIKEMLSATEILSDLKSVSCCVLTI